MKVLYTITVNNQTAQFELETECYDNELVTMTLQRQYDILAGIKTKKSVNIQLEDVIKEKILTNLQKKI